jgi:hypothetical protein
VSLALAQLLQLGAKFTDLNYKVPTHLSPPVAYSGAEEMSWPWEELDRPWSRPQCFGGW